MFVCFYWASKCKRKCVSRFWKFGNFALEKIFTNPLFGPRPVFIYLSLYLIGLSVVDNFTINVQDTNDAPSDILFSGSLSIQENSPAGSPVGTASAVDEDFSQTHTYAIDSIVGERYRAAM